MFLIIKLFLPAFVPILFKHTSYLALAHIRAITDMK